jgi:hypothetical protein
MKATFASYTAANQRRSSSVKSLASVRSHRRRRGSNAGSPFAPKRAVGS